MASLAGLAGPAVAGVNWPQFRGPAGDGITAETGLPVHWSESEHVTWKTAIHGRGWSSPVIWDEQIWMTTATPDGHELSAVCVDREGGKILHDVLVFKIAEPQFCHPLNSYATPTPVVEKGRVYVHYGVHGTAALDTESGKILWTRQDFPCNHCADRPRRRSCTRICSSWPLTVTICSTSSRWTKPPARPHGDGS